MKNWISRLFGGSPEPQAAPITVAGPATTIDRAPDTTGAPGSADSADADDTETLDGGAADALFYRWLVGPADAVAASTEQLILDELARLAASPSGGANLVPRVPAVIPQLLKSLRDEGVSGADLSRQIAQDVVLVAEVIREANSPYYHPTAPIKTIEGAVMLLGQNGLRMLLARVSFRPIISMQSGYFAKRVAPQVWSQSEKCALAGSLLAPALQANPFEAYLCGLMHNVGMIVAFRLIDQIYHEQTLPESDQFCAGLAHAARVLSARIAALWDFPASVVEAIERMDDASVDEPDAPALARALAAADRLSKLRMLVDAGQLDADDPQVTGDMDRATLKCFDKLRMQED